MRGTRNQARISLQTGVAFIVLIGLLPECLASQSAPRHSDHPSPKQTYSAKTFRFSYPATFQVCTIGNLQPCIHSMIPTCDDDAIVCVAYPDKEFGETTFQGEAFEVREIHTSIGTQTPDICVTPYPPKYSTGVSEYPEYMISAKEPARTIGGVLFVHGIKGDAAMSHSSSVDVYRAFHNGRCWELAVSQTFVNGQVFDPPRRDLTREQQKKVDASMNEILESFRFVK